MSTVTRTTALADLPELLSVPEAAVWVGVGKGLVYELVRSGELPSVLFGTKLLRETRDGLAARRDAANKAVAS